MEKMDGKKDERKRGKGQEDKKESGYAGYVGYVGYLNYDSEIKKPTCQSSAAVQICIMLALDHH